MSSRFDILLPDFPSVRSFPFRVRARASHGERAAASLSTMQAFFRVQEARGADVRSAQVRQVRRCAY